MPLVEKAIEQGSLTEHFKDKIHQLQRIMERSFPKPEASLIHGDLWGGNILYTRQGGAVLIDPAVSYADREMDFAMTKLFGGFGPNFYKAYESLYPLEKDWDRRISCYQLYYLLVHLVLFGRTYLGSVERAINSSLKN